MYFAEKVLITRLTTQKWLDVGPEWIEEEHRSAHSRMVYEYRVTCAAHYYGKGCENLCRPRDDNFGHYSCSPTGERVCLSGWKGDYCATRKSIIILVIFIRISPITTARDWRNLHSFCVSLSFFFLFFFFFDRSYRDKMQIVCGSFCSSLTQRHTELRSAFESKSSRWYS